MADSIDRLRQWRINGALPMGYSAGVPAFASDVIAMLDDAERKTEMLRARLIDAREHILRGRTEVAIVDINRALEAV